MKQGSSLMGGGVVWARLDPSHRGAARDWSQSHRYVLARLLSGNNRALLRQFGLCHGAALLG